MKCGNELCKVICAEYLCTDVFLKKKERSVHVTVQACTFIQIHPYHTHTLTNKWLQTYTPMHANIHVLKIL